MRTKEFNISWFATILGTGGVALASQPFFPVLTLALTYILTPIFLFLNIIWLAKIVMHGSVVKREIQHLVLGNFYPLQPISAVTLAILYQKLSIPFLDIALLAYGGVLILLMVFYLSYHFFVNVTPQLHQINGGWFIPPVSTILVTNAILQYPPDETLFAISLIYFGMGMMLFLFIATILFLRLVSHKLPSTELAPTNFIILAPIGILIVDTLTISHYTDTLFGVKTFVSASTLSISLWGFGLWALVVNLMILIKYVNRSFPFFLGWWSYVFPTAAFALATNALATHLTLFKPVSMAIYLFLITVWIAVVVRSFKLLIKLSFSTTAKMKLYTSKSKLLG